MEDEVTGNDMLGLRPIIWRILLGVYPLNPKEWDDTMEQNLQKYTIFREEFYLTEETILRDHYKESEKETFEKDKELARKESHDLRVKRIREGKKNTYDPHILKN